MKTGQIILAAIGLVFAFGVTNNASAEDLKNKYKRPKKVPYPETNKPSKARQKLGHMLFFEPRLSGSKVMSCATCHNPSLGWEDGLPLGIGHGHKQLGRKTPTVLNLAWADRLFWDGRAENLEAQALGPIESPGEMNMPLGDAVGSIKAIKGYEPLFEKAYPGEGITKDTIAKAIANYERTIVSGEAPFDRWINGKGNAISAAAKRGFNLFNGKAKCADCHSGWAFTDHGFHDVGLKSNDIGRGKFLKLQSQQHAFKTPGLRNIDQRGPYFHDGSAKTLTDVVEFYNKGGDVDRPSKSGSIVKLGLTKKEVADLVKFMETLTSKDKPVVLPILPM